MTRLKPFLKVVSLLALFATITPPVLYLLGRMEIGPTKLWMGIATIAWFVATPMWMERS